MRNAECGMRNNGGPAPSAPVPGLAPGHFSSIPLRFRMPQSKIVDGWNHESTKARKTRNESMKYPKTYHFSPLDSCAVMQLRNYPVALSYAPNNLKSEI